MKYLVQYIPVIEEHLITCTSPAKPCTPDTSVRTVLHHDIMVVTLVVKLQADIVH